MGAKDRKMTVSDIFRHNLLRQIDAGNTVYQIAKRSGLSHSSVYGFKSGKYVPGLDSAERIAQTLGYTLGEFISDPNAKEHDVNECFKRVALEWGKKRR